MLIVPRGGRWQVIYAAGVNEKLLGDSIKKHNVRDRLFGTCVTAVDVNVALGAGHQVTISVLSRRVGRSLTHGCLVASKCGFSCFNGGGMTVTNTAEHIKEYTEGTIERLGFTPDLYYLHRIDPSASHLNPTRTQ